MACEKLPTRYDIWKEWQKNSLNSRWHKLLVLLGLLRSPTFEQFRFIRYYELDDLPWEINRDVEEAIKSAFWEGD